MNENSNKAITDGMNMIFAKMNDLERRNDETLKKEIEEIRRRVEEDTNRRKNSAQIDNKESKERERELLSRITELETVIIRFIQMIEREIDAKAKLAADIKAIQEHRSQLEERNVLFERKVKELEVKETTLIEEIGEFESLKENYQNTVNECNTLKAENAVFIEKLKAYEKDHECHRHTVDSHYAGWREKEKRF